MFLRRKKIAAYFGCMLSMLLVLAGVEGAFAQGGIFAEDIAESALSKREGPNIHIGSLEFHPFAGYEQKYDSNIYLEPDNGDSKPNGDMISDIKLGTGAMMPLVPEREEDFMLKGYYYADILMFWKNSGRNRVDHHAMGDLELNFANDVKFRLNDTFVKTADPPNSERTSLDKRIRNVLDGALSYNREKITGEVAYSLARDNYMTIANLRKNDHMMTLTGWYQMFPKTSILGEYNYGIIDYDENTSNSNSYYHQGRVGVEGQILPKVTGIAKFGAEYRHYYFRQRKDYLGFTMDVKLKYDATERTQISLGASKRPVESTYQINSFYDATRLQLDLKHQLLKRLQLGGTSFFQYDQYPERTAERDEMAFRRDTLWGLEGGLDYEIREWCHVGTAYKFKQRHSRFREYDYNDHQVLCNVTLTY
ncbi:outer membrane beta-barrel protein [Candidatus Omnitrophota bacterium]